MLKLAQTPNSHLKRTAIKSDNQSYSYQDLLLKSESIALKLLAGKDDLKEARIAFILAPGFDYVAILWGIWRAGGIAVPLCVKHPFASLNYVIEDTEASAIIYSEEFETLLKPFSSYAELDLLALRHIEENSGDLPDIVEERRALILYTSGTTGSPKGVVSSHRNIQAQVESLVEAWEWQQGDQILNVLPMHHVHGIINATCCPLAVGACVEFLPKFDPARIFEIFLQGQVNVFMAVPTIYFKLIGYWEGLNEEKQSAIYVALKKFRLMVSGSAALPISVLEKWRIVSGHTLLERYGMTEMGMAISNPYRGERKPGYIGQALPNVRIRLADENNEVLSVGEQGEIQIKGPNIFKEYWRKPEATTETFTKDGWFKTGDISIYEEGAYKILGRNSVDIIKSGGYKISALEIEEVLRSYEGIKDCAVVGIPNEEWGEIIGASLVLEKEDIELDKLGLWLKEKLPNYKMPRKYIIQEDLPRNVMGKVTKKELKKMFN